MLMLFSIAFHLFIKGDKSSLFPIALPNKAKFLISSSVSSETSSIFKALCNLAIDSFERCFNSGMLTFKSFCVMSVRICFANFVEEAIKSIKGTFNV